MSTKTGSGQKKGVGQLLIPLIAICLLIIFNLFRDPGFFSIETKLNTNGNTVLAGNLIGAGAAVGNYLLLGITVAKAAGGPPEKVAMKVRSSMTARMLGQAVICAAAVGILKTNVYATILPLLFPRIGIAFRPMIDRKRGKTAERDQTAEAEGSDLLD